MIYIYDGSFDGFLTCVYLHYYEEKAEGITLPEGSQFDLIRSSRTVETSPEKATIVYKAIENKISRYDIERIYRVFCTDTPEKEMLLLRYIIFGFKTGSGIGLLHSHPAVLDVKKAELKIGNEVHRYCGLIRFSVAMPALLSESNSREILYSAIDPDNDVLEFLAPHFTDRFKCDPFIIHDTKRNKALIAYDKQWYISAFSIAGLLTSSPEEKEYQRLWKKYFDTMAIKERTNPRCQRNLMPARYWKNLPEMTQL